MPGRADMLLAAAGEEGLWRSLDGGLTWAPVPGGGQAGVVGDDDARGPGSRRSSPVRSSSGSNDYGVVWHKAGWPDARLVASDPRNARIFLAVHRRRHDPGVDRRRDARGEAATRSVSGRGRSVARATPGTRIGPVAPDLERRVARLPVEHDDAVALDEVLDREARAAHAH